MKNLARLQQHNHTQPTLPLLMASLQGGTTFFESLTGKLSHPLIFSNHSRLQFNRISSQHSQDSLPVVREMLALPARLGGLGLMNPVTIAEEQHAASQLISAPLVEQILNQDNQLADCQAAQQDMKARVRSNKRLKQKEDAKNLQNQLPVPLQHSIWCFFRRKEHRPGSQHCQLMIMGLPFTNQHSEMPSLFDITGHSRIHPPIAVAAIHSVSSMP